MEEEKYSQKIVFPSLVFSFISSFPIAYYLLFLIFKWLENSMTNINLNDLAFGMIILFIIVYVAIFYLQMIILLFGLGKLLDKIFKI